MTITTSTDTEKSTDEVYEALKKEVKEELNKELSEVKVEDASTICELKNIMRDVSTEESNVLFRLDSKKYEEYLEEGTIDPKVKEAFEKEDYPVEDDAELFEELGKWFISEDGDRKYIIERWDEKLNRHNPTLKVLPYYLVIKHNKPSDSFVLDKKYEKYIEPGSIKAELKEAFEKEDYPVEDDAELSKEHSVVGLKRLGEEKFVEKYVIYENANKKYTILFSHSTDIELDSKYGKYVGPGPIETELREALEEEEIEVENDAELFEENGNWFFFDNRGKKIKIEGWSKDPYSNDQYREVLKIYKDNPVLVWQKQAGSLAILSDTLLKGLLNMTEDEFYKFIEISHISTIGFTDCENRASSKRGHDECFTRWLDPTIYFPLMQEKKRSPRDSKNIPSSIEELRNWIIYEIDEKFRRLISKDIELVLKDVARYDSRPTAEFPIYRLRLLLSLYIDINEKDNILSLIYQLGAADWDRFERILKGSISRKILEIDEENRQDLIEDLLWRPSEKRGIKINKKKVEKVAKDQDEDIDKRKYSIRLLYRIVVNANNKKSKGPLELLLDLTRDDRKEIKKSAIENLGKLDKNDIPKDKVSSVLERLVKLLGEEKDEEILQSILNDIFGLNLREEKLMKKRVESVTEFIQELDDNGETSKIETTLEVMDGKIDDLHHDDEHSLAPLRDELEDLSQPIEENEEKDTDSEDIEEKEGEEDITEGRKIEELSKHLAEELNQKIPKEKSSSSRRRFSTRSGTSASSGVGSSGAQESSTKTSSTSESGSSMDKDDKSSIQDLGSSRKFLTKDELKKEVNKDPYTLVRSEGKLEILYGDKSLSIEDIRDDLPTHILVSKKSEGYIHSLKEVDKKFIRNLSSDEYFMFKNGQPIGSKVRNFLTIFKPIKDLESHMEYLFVEHRYNSRRSIFNNINTKGISIYIEKEYQSYYDFFSSVDYIVGLQIPLEESDKDNYVILMRLEENSNTDESD